MGLIRDRTVGQIQLEYRDDWCPEASAIATSAIAEYVAAVRRFAVRWMVVWYTIWFTIFLGIYLGTVIARSLYGY